MAKINRELARIFEEMAILEELEEVKWKPRAYRKAARGVRGMGKSVEDIYKEEGKKGLKEIDGVGDSIADHIIEYLDKGKMKKYEKLAKKWPSDIKEMMNIEGLGPKKVKKLIKKLKVKSVKDLKKKAKEEKVREVEGFDKKTEESILNQIHAHKKGKERMLLNEALPVAEEIIDYLKEGPVERIDYVGSLKRMKETVGDIDILTISSKPKKVMDLFTKMDGVKRVNSKGKTRSQVVLKENDIQVDIRVIPKKSYAAALQYFTGSKQHNIETRKIALKKGYKLSEYGLFKKSKKGKGKKIPCTSEKTLYKKLGLDYIPPELRETRGEIEAAKKGELPDLIELGDIRGDLQMHTKQTDGNKSLKEMVKACRDKGYKFMAITDHSKSRTVSNGLSVERLKKQWKKIDKVNKQNKKIKVLKGIEVDILKNGDLDYSDKTLNKADLVIVAIHSNFKQSKGKMTDRIVKALKNKNVNILAHPTGRLIGQRDRYNYDFDKVCKVAKKNNVALEINANPERLDLNDDYILAAKNGNKFTINTDSHSLSNLNFMRYGVATARRGWLEKKDVINTYDWKKLKKFLGK